MTLSIANDFQVIDNPASVAYASKTAEGTYAAPVTVPNVLSRVTNKTVDGMMNVQVATFHLWASQTSGLIPKVNDRLTVGGKTWVIKDVNSESLDTRFKLPACLMRMDGEQAVPTTDS